LKKNYKEIEKKDELEFKWII